VTDEDLGPIDSRTWPRELTAHAVTPGAERRLFGYDVERDLAAFYRFSDLLFLSLVGELPDDARSRAFEIALCFALPVPVADAGVHGPVLARLCGARPSGVLSVAGLVLGEQTTATLAAASAALEARERGESAGLPAALRATSEPERASVGALASMLTGLVEVPVLADDPSREIALVAVLRACGITSAFQLASLLALVRIPSAVAEASRVKPGDFATYPIDTPHFEYVAPEGEATR
jgi:hypothetical protein